MTDHVAWTDVVAAVHVAVSDDLLWILRSAPGLDLDSVYQTDHILWHPTILAVGEAAYGLEAV